MIKKSGDTYTDGFNDGVKCAWEEYSELIDNYLNEYVARGLNLNNDLEAFLQSLKNDVKKQYSDPSGLGLDDHIERYSTLAELRLKQ